MSILEFAGILLLIPIDAITFRDIGLLGAFIALWLMLRQRSPDFVSDQNQENKIEDPRSASRHLAKQIGSEPVVETFEEFMGQK